MTKEDMIKETHDAVIRLETQAEYTNNHLQNIDSHLNKLNERTDKNEKAIAIVDEKSKGNKDWIFRLGIPTCGSIVLAVIIFILKTVGVF